MELNRKLFFGGVFLFATVMIAGAWCAGLLVSLPGIQARPRFVPQAMEWAETDLKNMAIDGSLFRTEPGDPSATAGPLAKRFRLAGTFLAKESGRQWRRAVVDIPAQGIQLLVAEGEELDGSVMVASVFRDRIVLREGTAEENIWLSFSEAVDAGKEPLAHAAGGAADDGEVLGRFGKRVGDKRWVLRRDSVLEYYQELLNDTLRLASVFDSMKPVYEGNGIQGYMLEIEGEGGVFNAFGLQEGDVIRGVNSMPMTNRRRAEYFIREFVADRANAFVLDIERDGRMERLVYMLR